MSFTRSLLNITPCEGCDLQDRSTSSSSDFLAAIHETEQHLRDLWHGENEVSSWEALADIANETQLCEAWVQLLRTAETSSRPGDSSYYRQICEVSNSPILYGFRAWMTETKRSKLSAHIALYSSPDAANGRIWHRFPILSLGTLLSHFYILIEHTSRSQRSTIICVDELSPVNVTFLGSWFDISPSIFLQHTWRARSAMNSSQYLGHGLDVLSEPVETSWMTDEHEFNILEPEIVPPSASTWRALELHKAVHRLVRAQWTKGDVRSEADSYRTWMPLMTSELVMPRYVTAGFPLRGSRRSASVCILGATSFIVGCTSQDSNPLGIVFDSFLSNPLHGPHSMQGRSGGVKSVIALLNSVNVAGRRSSNDIYLDMRLLTLLSILQSIDALRLPVASNNHDLGCIPRSQQLDFYESMASRTNMNHVLLTELSLQLESSSVEVLEKLPPQQQQHLSSLVVVAQQNAARLQRTMTSANDLIQHKRDSHIAHLQIQLTKTQIHESRLAIRQASTVHRLTILAFIYIPTSCVCGLFGMNIVETPQGFALSTFGTTLAVVLLTTLLLAFSGRISVFLVQTFCYHLPALIRHFWRKRGLIRLMWAIRIAIYARLNRYRARWRMFYKECDPAERPPPVDNVNTIPLDHV